MNEHRRNAVLAEAFTRPQRLAFSDPCRLAGETTKPTFRHQKGLHSIVLTVNTGYE